MIELYGYIIKKIADVFLGEKIKDFLNKSKSFGKALTESFNTLKELKESLNLLSNSLNAKSEILDGNCEIRIKDLSDREQYFFLNTKLLLHLDVTPEWELTSENARIPKFYKTRNEFKTQKIEISYKEIVNRSIKHTIEQSKILVRQAAFSLYDSMDLISNELLQIYGNDLYNELQKLYAAEEKGLLLGSSYETIIEYDKEIDELHILLKNVSGDTQNAIKGIFPDFKLPTEMYIKENQDLCMNLNDKDDLHRAIKNVDSLLLRVDLSLTSLKEFIRNNWKIQDLI